MTTQAAVTPDEYLRTDYSPDVDYVDGELEERNVGEWDHGRLQYALAAYLKAREAEWGVLAGTEIRVQVSQTRFRVPDLLVVASRPKGGIVTEPPLLCIEILSPEDKLKTVRRKIEDYLAFGVPCVWLIDPEDRSAEIWTRDGMRSAANGVLEAGDIRVPLSELGV